MQIQENISLLPYNTFRMDVLARYLARIKSCSELEAFGERLAALPANPVVLGGGSNILFTRDVDGWVVCNEISGMEITGEDNDHVYVKTGGGENWHRFVLFCIDHNLAGVENLSLIPGNTGASPMQNIGAYGVELKDVFHELKAWHIKDKAWVKFSNTDCHFGYRESVFKRTLKDQFIIASVTYKLRKKTVFHISYGAIEQELSQMGITELSIRAVSDAVIRIRLSKLPDPAVIGNAGSFFKNPEIGQEQFEELKLTYPKIVGYPLPGNRVKLAAGWLIEQAGWKGYREGDAGCHEKQALVLVNHGRARGKDIYALSEKILQDVHARFGVKLEREVNIY
jgi:UDP-N-acetylmuramate dehydrogenase